MPAVSVTLNQSTSCSESIVPVASPSTETLPLVPRSGRVLVVILRDVADRQLVLACREAKAGDRDVVGAVRVRSELHSGHVAGATILAVRGVEEVVAVRIVERDDRSSSRLQAWTDLGRSLGEST